jgi:hypothetical protein
MKDHFKSNHRLRWCFKICKDLGIDDPVHWMNSVSPSVVDQWIAFELNEADTETPKNVSSPEEALQHIQSLGFG